MSTTDSNLNPRAQAILARLQSRPRFAVHVTEPKSGPVTMTRIVGYLDTIEEAERRARGWRRPGYTVRIIDREA